MINKCTSKIIFTEEMMLLFSKISKDTNPLHIDEHYARNSPYGQRVVFGILAAIAGLRFVENKKFLQPTEIKLDFMKPFYLGVVYYAEIVQENEFLLVIRLGNDDEENLQIQLYSEECKIIPSYSYERGIVKESTDIAIDYKEEEFSSDYSHTERYEIDTNLTEALLYSLLKIDCNLSKNLIQLLFLSSYVIGMRMPGKRALFTKLHLNNIKNTDDKEFTPVIFSVEKNNFNEEFRLIDLNIYAECKGNIIGSGNLCAFVHRNINLIPLIEISELLNSKQQDLKGKVGLVVGGSRGLGATFVQALAIKGCSVLVNYCQSHKAAAELAEQLKASSSSDVYLYQGDIAKSEICKGLMNFIHKNFGRLDFLILNAFMPPMQSKFDKNYILSNDVLYKELFKTLGSFLTDSGCTIIGISSGYVMDGPSYLKDYITSKCHLEDFIQDLARENLENRHFIVRPPELITDMNNTPAGLHRAISPCLVSAKIVNMICGDANKYFTDNNVCVVDDFNVKEKQLLNIAATFACDYIEESLDYWIEKWKKKIHTRLLTYNQIIQDIYNLESALYNEDVKLNVMLVRFEDWYRFKGHEDDYGIVHRNFNYNSNADIFYNNYLSDFVGALKFHDGNLKSKTILVICPSSSLYTEISEWSALFLELEKKLVNTIEDLSGIELIKACDFHSAYEVENIICNTSDVLGHIPFTQDYYSFLGTIIIRRYFSIIHHPFKVIVLDCDNTLWKGIVGEDGPDGIIVNDLYKAWQNKLVGLNMQGYLICLCSKNNQDDILEVFAENTSMVLRMENITAYKLNWKRKSENINELSKILNVGLDSFIFIDDNPVECEEVKINCKQVLTLQWPESEQEGWDFINHMWALDDYHKPTQEDMVRTAFYKVNSEREKLKSESSDFMEFLESLNVEIEITKLKNNSINRAYQLNNRTNQFNMNPVHKTEKEINNLLESEQYRIFKIEVKDRFGTYGFAGLVIAILQTELLYIESFMLSCRVLGRGVEYKILQYLGKFAVDNQLASVVFNYRKSGKNQLVFDFFENICKEISGSSKVENEKDIIEYHIDSDSLINTANIMLKQKEDIPHVNKIIRPIKEGSGNTFYLRDIESILTNVYKISSSQSKIWNCLNEEVMNCSETKENIPDLRRNAIKQDIVEVISNISGLDSSKISFDIPIESFQFSSLKKIEISAALTNKYRKLSPTFMYEFNTLGQVVQFINPTVDVECRKKNVKGSDIPDNSKEESDEVAIIGINLKLPGANSKDEFWNNIRNGKSSIGEIPKNRWDIDRFYSPDNKATGKSHSKWGGFIENVESFDNTFFGISHKEAEAMDPQQRLLLENVWGLIEDAGYRPEDIDQKTGVFVGVISSDFGILLNEASKDGYSPYRWGDYYQIANRISYFYNLKGPSIAVDTACSSSGTALYMACQCLKSGDCKTAIVGGVNLILHPGRYIQYSKMGLLSSEECCKPFSAEAKGTVMGEGIVSVLLKPLNKAIEDGDYIYGSIKSCAINSGGKTNGFTVPNPNAQTELIQTTIQKSKINKNIVSYIEAHGTGTIVGDPIEIQGIAKAYLSNKQDKQTCFIGTVKSNIGHLESAAALAGIVKILLQMKYKKLVPSINALPLSSYVSAYEPDLKIQTDLCDWNPLVYEENGISKTVLRRAGISSFGAGGSNFHAILEEYYERIDNKLCMDLKSNVILLSARDENALFDLVMRLRNFINWEKDNAAALDDKSFFHRIAYTLQAGRKRFSYRLGIIAYSLDDLIQKLNLISEQGYGNNDIIYEFSSGDIVKIEWDMDEADKEYLKKLFHKGQLIKLAFLWLKGLEIDWKYIYADYKLTRIPIPGYSFKKNLFPLAKLINSRHQKEPFTILNIPWIKGEIFQTFISMKELPFLSDHIVNDSCLLPGAFPLGLILTGLQRLFGLNGFILENIDIRRAVVLDDNQEYLLQYTIDKNVIDKKIELFAKQLNSSNPEEEWFLYTSAKYGVGPVEENGIIDIISIQQRSMSNMKKEEFYKNGLINGFSWGTRFQWVEKVWLSENDVLARISYENNGDEPFYLPPSILDACLQPFIFAMEKHCNAIGEYGIYVPYTISSFKIYRKIPNELYTYLSFSNMKDLNKEYFTVNCKILDLNGAIIGEIERLSLKYINGKIGEGKSELRNCLYKPYWEKLVLSDRNLPECKISESMILDFSVNKEAFAGIKTLLKKDYGGIEYNTINIEVGKIDSITSLIIMLYSGTEEIQFDGDAYSDEYFDSTIMKCFKFLTHISRLYTGKPINILYITRNAQCVNKGEVVSPIGNAMLGLIKVITSEFKNINVRCIDSLSNGQEDDTEKFLFNIKTCLNLFENEVFKREKNRYEELVVRKNEILKKYVVQVEDSKNMENDSLFKKKGYYLIIGGAGGIGYELSLYLTEKWNARILWIGRSNIEKISKKIEAVECMGGQIKYLQVDARDYKALKSAIREIDDFEKLNGIFHAAAILKDAPLFNMAEAEFKEVFDTKAKIIINILKLAKVEKLDFISAFSSECSFRGSPAQANYVTGSRFLDAYLYSVYVKKGINVKIINWGYWGKTGIVAAEEYKNKLERNGILPFDNTEGQEIIDIIFRLPVPQIMVVKINQIYKEKVSIIEKRAISLPGIDQKGRIDYIPASNEKRIGEKVTTVREEDTLVHEIINSREINTNGSHITGGEVTANLNKEFLEILSAYYPRMEKITYIEKLLVRELKKIIGLKDTDTLPNNVTFQNLGLDSLLAIEFRNIISDYIGEDISITIVFDYPNIHSMASFLLEKYAGSDKYIKESPSKEKYRSSKDRIQSSDFSDDIEQINKLSDDEAINALMHELYYSE